MKLLIAARTLFVFILLLGGSHIYGQFYILGRGLDEEEHPYAFAEAELHGEGILRQLTCTDLGVFRFENLKAGSYELVLITPYGIRRKKIELRGSIDVTLHIPRSVEIDEISVVARRAGSNEPVTHDDISSEDLRKRDTGQDMPYLLEGSPSLVVTSDAGHGIGYTGLRIRGTDPTRINVTLNGIPVNDAESHNVFWVDLPDIAGSTSNVQIQRGIGWSQPGAGDLGAGIHLNTLAFNHEAYAGLDLGAGSFGTKRASINAGSGLLKGRFTFDGRGSYIYSNGFIDRARSELYSIYGSAGYHHDQTNVRLVYSLGDELTYQAWNGVPEQFVNDIQLRTFNSAGIEKGVDDPYENQVDDYKQSHYQIHFDQALTPFARWSTALHYTKGKGFFEEYKADQNLVDYSIDTPGIFSDLTRQRWLDNNFYGFTSTIQVGRPMQRYFVMGVGWNEYKGDHFGRVISIENQALFTPQEYYHNKAEKNDLNLFGRSNLKISEKLHATIDIQGRWIKYFFESPDDNGTLNYFLIKHRFLNPKVGVNLQLSAESSIYGLSGIQHKEPNRDDFVNSIPSNRPRSERLWDHEIGFRYAGKSIGFELTGYYMLYKDQLVLTGRLNDVGAYTRVNVDQSHRAGVESNLSFSPVKQLTVKGQITVSDNQIKQYDEYIDNWDTGQQEKISHRETQIAFSPNFLAGIQTEYELFSKSEHSLTFGVSSKYVGRQYVDNTSRQASLLDEYFVTDAVLHWAWNSLWAKEFRISLFMKNAFNHQYESNGWIYRFRSVSDDPTDDEIYAGREDGSLYHLKGYFPQAGRHFFVNLTMIF